ncbi:MAG TPA: hypothetical protein VFB60_15785 [Ktedonobacteraceae bacterium]|nr:hypothetical protein [Ktedonobacteraceae bacterium]
MFIPNNILEQHIHPLENIGFLGFQTLRKLFQLERLFIEPTAAWMYAMQRLLFLSGLSAGDPATFPDDNARSLEEIRVAWLQRHPWLMSEP